MTTPGKGRIFISYRRADSAGYAGRIYDRLTAHFGVDTVFMDVDVIPAGVDFVETLQNAVQSCDVLIALIGRSWLNIKDEAGKRRLDNPEDFVRIEVAAALSRNIRVIPVLVDGVTMPRLTELPGNLKPLARRNALQVNHHSFNADARRLISQLELALEKVEHAKIEKMRREEEARAKLAEEEKRRQETAADAAQEKGARENAEAKEHARVAVVQQIQKEREEQEYKESVEKARIEREEHERKSAPAVQIGRTFGNERKKSDVPSWLPYVFGGGIPLVCVVVFGLGYFVYSLVPSIPTPTKRSSTEVSATSLPTNDIPINPTITTSIPTATKHLPTEISATSLPTITPPANPAVGSTWVQTKDGMVMVYIPEGEFEMGYNDGHDREKPVHIVFLSAYWIDKTEVTNAMYIKCVQSGNCELPSSMNSFTHDNYFESSEFNNYPVIYVSWVNAKSYCEWVGRRLPTEAEWEKAASWDDEKQQKYIYPWGNTFDGTRLNYCDKNCSFDWADNVANDGYADIAPVGNFQNGRSFYGVLDMTGNVYEWVADWMETGIGTSGINYSSYYANSPYMNPLGTETGELRVVRGGGWGSRYDGLITASRYAYSPSKTENDLGFRCANDISP